MLGKIEGGRRRGWQDEFEQTLGGSEGQGSLACCSPSGHRELYVTWWLNSNHHKEEKEIIDLSLSTMFKHHKKVMSAIHEEGFRGSGHAGTLILDFQSPELWEINVLLFKPPSMVFCCSNPSRLRHWLLLWMHLSYLVVIPLFVCMFIKLICYRAQEHKVYICSWMFL